MPNIAFIEYQRSDNLETVSADTDLLRADRAKKNLPWTPTGCRKFVDNVKFSGPLLPVRKPPWYGMSVRIADSV
jgi:hypothetical protein